jgi:uncharacterized RDD family membrane protein YckC
VETFSIQTAQNVAIGVRVASIGPRLGAYLLDGLIVVSVLKSVDILVSVTDIVPEAVYPYINLILFGLLVMYFPVSEMLWNGQTVGKRILNIRVVKSDGSSPRFYDYLVRGIVGMFECIGTFGGLALCVALISKRSQRIGDHIAGTVVVRVLPPVSLSQLVDAIESAEATMASAVTFPQVSRLSDKDIDTIRRVLVLTRGSQYSTDRATTLLYDMARRIEHVLGLGTVQTDATTFLRTILKDHQIIHGAMTTIDSVRRR